MKSMYILLLKTELIHNPGEPGEMVMRYAVCCDHNDDIEILTSYQSLTGPVISQPGRVSFELNTEGRMEGDDRRGHLQISLSHFY